jgi:hypothetical protein
VLLVSCSYEHSNPGADVFKEYEEITAALKVGYLKSSGGSHLGP